MCFPNGDQSGQWRSISMTSQWPLIMTSQWVMTLLGMPIVISQWVMMLLGTSIVMSQWVIALLCVYIMTSQCIMMMLLTSIMMYSLLCLTVLFYYGKYGIKTKTSSFLISMDGEHIYCFLCRAISLIFWTREISLHKTNLCVLPMLIKHSFVLVIISIYLWQPIQVILPVSMEILHVYMPTSHCNVNSENMLQSWVACDREVHKYLKLPSLFAGCMTFHNKSHIMKFSQ